MDNGTSADTQLEQVSNTYRNGGLTKNLSDAQFGVQAKQAIRDRQVAQAVAAHKDTELADVWGRVQPLLEGLTAENRLLKSVIDPDSLAMG